MTIESFTSMLTHPCSSVAEKWYHRDIKIFNPEELYVIMSARNGWTISRSEECRI
jgi:hypothetical protein